MRSLDDLWHALPPLTNKHILLHASFRFINSNFSADSPSYFLEQLAQQIGGGGSLIVPTFTYNFKKSIGGYQVFNREQSPSVLGAISEAFRRQFAISRTSSPTHSFGLLGDVCNYIGKENNPASPLGAGSIPDWLMQQEESYILFVGTDLTVCTFLHYIENMLPVPYKDTFCWDYMHVLPVGVADTGETGLIEVPGCSKSFNRILPRAAVCSLSNSPGLLCFPVQQFYKCVSKILQSEPLALLCGDDANCPACNSRKK